MVQIYNQKKLMKELKFYFKNHYCWGLVCTKNACFC